MRVLYIDDDRINALLFEETVRFAPGVEIECAGSGAEALELAARWQPELLVVDLHLPDANGLALLAPLRAAACQPALPAYLCTADDAPQLVRAAAEAGFEGVWPKPVELGVVIQELKRRSTGAAGS
jgi:two-component system, OmpR family, response regulator